MRRRDELGSATVWMLVWLGLVTWAAQVGLLVAGVVARQHQVDAAADLAALSAATRLQQYHADACPSAVEVAAAHETDVTDCQVDGSDVLVELRSTVSLPLGLSIELRGVARAGP